MIKPDSLILLWLENSFPLNTRSERILNSVRHEGRYEIHVCAWNRGVPREAPRNNNDVTWHIFNRATANRGGRLAAKALSLPGYIRFINTLIQGLKPDLLGCSFWDMALAAAYAPTRAPVWYDVIDIPRGTGLQAFAGSMLEKLALRNVSAVSLASRFYEPIYEGISSRAVIENLPDFDRVPNPKTKLHFPPRLGFVGSVRYPETMTAFLSAAHEIDYPISVHGQGWALEELRDAYRECPGIYFSGAYEYQSLPEIYHQLDLVWAAYPSTDRNVELAISNKFFECIVFGVPGVFSEGTMLANMVERLGIGYAVNPYDKEGLGAWLQTLRNDSETLKNTQDRLLAYRKTVAGHLRWKDQDNKLLQLVGSITPAIKT